MNEALMGRPKKQPPPKGNRLPQMVGLRTTKEWAEWLDRGAKHCRTDMAKLIDAAVAQYLKAHGFEEPPPDRVP